MPILKLPEHQRSVFLCGVLRNAQYLEAAFIGAEGYFDYISRLNLIRRSCHLAVNRNVLCIAGIVCDRAPFYYSGNL